MKFAAIAKCPVFNGRPVKIDAAKARQVPGVRDIVEIKGAIDRLKEQVQNVE